MDAFLQAATTTLAGTLSIPEPIHPTATHSHSFTKTHHGHHSSSSSSTSGGIFPTGNPIPVPGRGHHQHAPATVEVLNKSGETALWIGFVAMTLTLLFTVFSSKRVARNMRLFHYLTAVILTTAMVSYLAMATGLGKALVPITSKGHDGKIVLRELFYARYIDWALTTPLLLIDLALLAGLPLTTAFQLVVADEAMIITGLLSALHPGGHRQETTYKFIFYGVSCFFFLYVLYTLVVSGRASAKLQSDKVAKTFMALSLLTIITWTAYPIIFALAEGTGIISVDLETIFYAILDITAKCGFAILLLIAHGHTEGDSIVLPESWTTPRNGNYGSISLADE